VESEAKNAGWGLWAEKAAMRAKTHAYLNWVRRAPARKKSSHYREKITNTLQRAFHVVARRRM